MSGTVSLWRIATDTPNYTAEDLSGAGAKASGGRWNRKGSPVVYSALTRALACLETVVHFNAGGLPLNRYLVEIQVPMADYSARTQASAASLPVGWDALPAGKVSLDFGDSWLASQSTLLLEVPSVIVPEEYNVLINPAHPHASRVTARKVRRWTYDGRLNSAAPAVFGGRSSP